MVTLESMCDALRTWNLKYDEFPEVLKVGTTVLVAVSQSYCHEFEFTTEQEAEEAVEKLHKAMKDRADNYWNC